MDEPELCFDQMCTQFISEKFSQLLKINNHYWTLTMNPELEYNFIYQFISCDSDFLRYIQSELSF
ncbi:UNVERIFIED_ORG: hypothetical protein C7430_112130 [Pantoea agglomerans]|uniref:Uncharacterized protein n=1 Tax=Enterobacter agglomerans TaxID=549 RepID=A0ABD6XLK9_ENTAG